MKRIFLFLLFLSLAWTESSRANICKLVLNKQYIMQAGYVGEDQVPKLRSPSIWVTPRLGVVKYLASDEERAGHLLSMRNGRVYQGNQLLRGGNYFWSKPKTYIAVLDSDRRFFVGKEFRGGQFAFHHSSFNGGHPVLAPGKIRYNGKKIVEIDNNSGHYLPDDHSNVQMLNAMLEQGFEPPEKITFVFMAVSEIRPQSLIVKDAIKAWKRGEVYTLRWVDPEVIEEIRQVFEHFGYLK